MTELEKMVEQSRQVYDRLQLLQKQFEGSSDPYRNQAFRSDVLVAFSHTFDLAYDLNRYWSKLAEVETRREPHVYEVATPDGTVFDRGTYEANPLHEGECDACGRVAMLSHGLCEGCTIEGMME